MFTASSLSVGSISAGALLGTTGTAELVRSINDSLGGSSLIAAAQDQFRDIRNSFVENVLRPIQMSRAANLQRVNILMNPDVIRPLIDPIDFSAVPPCMWEAIVMHPPVRALLEQGRIAGFGFDPDNLPKEDTWGRLINNGVCENVLDAVDAEGKVWLSWEFHSTDPVVSFDELDAVELTRRSIDQMLSSTRFDPTDMPEERG
jgi:hypothetical protein